VKDWGPKPFRRVDVWQKEGSFKELIQAKWNTYEVRGNRQTILKEKLKCLKKR